jgi:NAD(P)-dependent dehydrogenase (short-subunit alcohol dehydrogenase family)
VTTVVVTGASAGVGRAAAVAFASSGASVGLLARGEAGLAGAAKDVEKAGGTPLALQADVADFDAVKRAAAEIEQALGPIDIWVNNAMATVFSPFARISAAEFRRCTEVTYLGTVHGTMAALELMQPRDRGTIVQVGSALAYRGIPLQSPYCGAKHAIQGFTESLRCELLHDGSGVHVTMVQMPALNTPQFGWSRNKTDRRPQPVPPIFDPEVAAQAIVWASRHRRKEVDVGWPTVKAIVGDKIASSLADHYLARTGYKAQLTSAPDNPARPDNLFEPCDQHRDAGAHGRFDDRAKTRSIQAWATEHRDLVRLGAAAGAAGAVAALMQTRLRGG